MHTSLIVDGQSVKVGGPRSLLVFDLHEAAYIRAAAGNLLAGDPVNPVGITSVAGFRYLLKADGVDIVITRHGLSWLLSPSQVMQAF